MFQTLVSNGVRCVIGWDVLLWCHRLGEFHFVAIVQVKVNIFLQTVKHSNRPMVYIYIFFFKCTKINKHTPVSSTGFHWKHFCQNTKCKGRRAATDIICMWSYRLPPRCQERVVKSYVDKCISESFKVMDIGQLFDPYCIWNYRPCFWVESGLDQIYSRRGVWSNALYKKAFDRLWPEGFQFCAGSKLVGGVHLFPVYIPHKIAEI